MERRKDARRREEDRYKTVGRGGKDLQIGGEGDMPHYHSPTISLGVGERKVHVVNIF